MHRMRTPRTHLCVLMLSSLAAHAADAQVLRGLLVVSGVGAVPDAQVTVRADSGSWRAMVSTDSAGRFRVLVPRLRTISIDVRRVGLEPITARTISLTGDSTEIVLRATMVAQPVPKVRVAGARDVGVDFTGGFAERRARGIGRFLVRTDIEKKSVTQPLDLLRGVPGLEVLATGLHPEAGEQTVVSGRGARSFGSGACTPTLFVDGLETDGTSININHRAGDFEAVEMYAASEVPAKFRSSSLECGAVLFWTRSKSGAPADSARTPQS